MTLILLFSSTILSKKNCRSSLLHPARRAWRCPRLIKYLSEYRAVPASRLSFRQTVAKKPEIVNNYSLRAIVKTLINFASYSSHNGFCFALYSSHNGFCFALYSSHNDFCFALYSSHNDFCFALYSSHNDFCFALYSSNNGPHFASYSACLSAGIKLSSQKISSPMAWASVSDSRVTSTPLGHRVAKIATCS